MSKRDYYAEMAQYALESYAELTEAAWWLGGQDSPHASAAERGCYLAADMAEEEYEKYSTLSNELA